MILSTHIVAAGGLIINDEIPTTVSIDFILNAAKNLRPNILRCVQDDM